MAKDASGAVLEERSWVYDGQLRVIAEVSASGALRARYLYASSGHSPDLAVRFDPDSGVVTGSYLLVHDQVGSVVRTVDLATGGAVESVAYDPWGVPTLAPGGAAVHPFGFAGGLWDRRTGLVRFGAREYDAGLGRWLARDPIGFAGGWNQYGYVAGNPVDFADPSGLANYEHPMQWLPPDADIRAGALLAEQEIAESLRDGLVGAMLWEIGGAVWARALWQGGRACTASARGVSRGGETAATAAGRAAHKNWRPPPGFRKEYRLPSGRRADAVNVATREVIELKPNNPRAIRNGQKQLEGYIDELQETTGQTWTGRVETYGP